MSVNNDEIIKAIETALGKKIEEIELPIVKIEFLCSVEGFKAKAAKGQGAMFLEENYGLTEYELKNIIHKYIDFKGIGKEFSKIIGNIEEDFSLTMN